MGIPQSFWLEILGSEREREGEGKRERERGKQRGKEKGKQREKERGREDILPRTLEQKSSWV